MNRTALRGGLAALALAMGLLATRHTAQAGFGQFEPLAIQSHGKSYQFQVEVMRTDHELAQGMMYRRSQAPDRGMLFEFAAEAPQTFWMENTYLPLDMLFIRSDGTIHRIEKNAEPLSERNISSGAPVSAVLEVVGGTADRLGLAPGDKVQNTFFHPGP